MQVTCEDVEKLVAVMGATLGREEGTFVMLHWPLGGGQLGRPVPHQRHQASPASSSVASQLQPHHATATALGNFLSDLCLYAEKDVGAQALITGRQR